MATEQTSSANSQSVNVNVDAKRLLRQVLSWHDIAGLREMGLIHCHTGSPGWSGLRIIETLNMASRFLQTDHRVDTEYFLVNNAMRSIVECCPLFSFDSSAWTDEPRTLGNFMLVGRLPYRIVLYDPDAPNLEHSFVINRVGKVYIVVNDAP